MSVLGPGRMKTRTSGEGAELFSPSPLDGDCQCCSPGFSPLRMRPTALSAYIPVRYLDSLAPLDWPMRAIRLRKNWAGPPEVGKTDDPYRVALNRGRSGGNRSPLRDD